MGIYDRDYVNPNRAGARRGRQSGGFGGAGLGGGFGGGIGGGGLGRLNTMSVNTWLIIINVAVFLVFNVVLGGKAVVVPYGKEYLKSATPAQIEASTVAQVPAQPVANMPGVYYQPIVAPAVDNPTELVAIGRDRFLPNQPVVTAWLSFSTWKGFLELQVWRLVTYQFAHANFNHILFNMFGLWMFGSMVEGQLGRKRYLAFYLACGVAGGLLYLILNSLGAMGINLPGALNIRTITPLVGASASVFGVLMASAFIAPSSRVYLLFLPVPLKLAWIAYGYVAFAALNLFVFQGNNQGGDAAHLGGAIAGFILIRNAHWLAGFLDITNDSTKPKKRGPKQKVRSRRAEAGTAEIDRILDKVRENGLSSLSDKERTILKKASETQQRRDS